MATFTVTDDLPTPPLPELMPSTRVVLPGSSNGHGPGAGRHASGQLLVHAALLVGLHGVDVDLDVVGDASAPQRGGDAVGELARVVTVGSSDADS